MTPSESTSPSAAAGSPPALALQTVADGFADPIGIEPGPAGTLLVQEKGGRLVGLDPADGTTWTAIDLRDRVLGQGEQGLLGVALHPEWPEDPRLFVHYTDRDGDTVLARFRSSDPSAAQPTFDAADELVLLRVDQPYPNHNGGQLAFGPDGQLWMALGDGGSGGDPLGHGQNPNTLLGAILRLDVGGPDATRYAIPADNPFVDGGGAPEVAHIGLRNPWRFSFDAGTGELFVADVGQNAYEEVSRIAANALGENLGWNVMEASHCYGDGDCEPIGVLPWTEYGREGGCSVTGGFVARDRALPTLDGWYLFSDYCSGLLYGVHVDTPTDGVAAPRVLMETGANVSSFGRDADGRLYLADVGSDRVLRIVAAE
jgi:glucose/arabinose dehydrogenase